PLPFPEEDRDLGFIIFVEPSTGLHTYGTVESLTINPEPLSVWGRIEWNSIEIPGTTSISMQVLYNDGFEWTVIPDNYLQGNELGFRTSPVDISALSVIDFAALHIRATLRSTDNTQTPELLDWQVSYKP
ncbi:MAG: hypothetical protein ABIH42_08765, partial [Planctomycetota bacterium]